MITTQDIMDYLVDNATQNLPVTALSDVFDSLIWCMNDNGKEILNVRKKWLSGDDFFRVQIALSMSETFPYDTKDHMSKEFNRICDKWPELKSRCKEIMDNWNNQFNS